MEYFEWREDASPQRKWKRFFTIILVLGLVYEIVEAADSDSQLAEAIKTASDSEIRSANAEKQAAAANESASIAKSNTAVALIRVQELRKANDELEARTEERRITPEQITNFILLTEKIPKCNVAILTGTISDETFRYACRVREMFTQAGFDIPEDDKQKVYGIHIDPGLLVYSLPDTTMAASHQVWPDIFIFQNFTNIISVNVPSDITNGFKRPIINQGTTDQAAQTVTALYNVLQEIGLNASGGYVPKPSGTNHWVVFVRPKP